MRDASIDEGPVLLFVEQNDEWFAIVRVDGARRTAHVHLRRTRRARAASWPATIFEEMPDDAVGAEVDARRPRRRRRRRRNRGRGKAGAAGRTPNRAAPPTCSPTSASARSQLLAMCAAEGMLPADVIAAVCERLGCAEEIEVYR